MDKYGLPSKMPPELSYTGVKARQAMRASVAEGVAAAGVGLLLIALVLGVVVNFVYRGEPSTRLVWLGDLALLVVLLLGIAKCSAHVADSYVRFSMLRRRV